MRQLGSSLVFILAGLLGIPAGAAPPGEAPKRAPAGHRAAPIVQSPSSPGADERFFAVLRRFARWFDPNRTNQPAVEARLEILGTAGMSAGLAGMKLQYRWRSPDRAQLRGAAGGEAFVLGRNGSELWLWRPEKGRVWRAHSTADDPLEQLSLPMMGVWLPRLETLFSVKPESPVALDGGRCEGLTGSTQGSWLGVPAFSLTLWLEQKNARLRRFRMAVPEQHRSLTVAVHELRERPAGETFRWAAPAGAGNRVETVSIARMRGAFPDAFHEAGLFSLVAP